MGLNGPVSGSTRFDGPYESRSPRGGARGRHPHPRGRGPGAAGTGEKRKPGRFVEIEGTADLVVEVVSDASVAKTPAACPPLYAAAGVAELWLVDARGETLDFRVHRLESGTYLPLQPDADG